MYLFYAKLWVKMMSKADVSLRQAVHSQEGEVVLCDG